MKLKILKNKINRLNYEIFYFEDRIYTIDYINDLLNKNYYEKIISKIKLIKNLNCIIDLQIKNFTELEFLTNIPFNLTKNNYIQNSLFFNEYYVFDIIWKLNNLSITIYLLYIYFKYLIPIYNIYHSIY